MQSIEQNTKLNGRSRLIMRASELCPSINQSDDVLAYHLMLIIEEQWLKGRYLDVAGTFMIERLTKEGHDFIDATRDTSIWEKAKSRANDAGGATLQFVWEIAKTLVRTEITKHIGPLLP